MNRLCIFKPADTAPVPRMRGDEPGAYALMLDLIYCSPHARG